MICIFDVDMNIDEHIDLYVYQRLFMSFKEILLLKEHFFLRNGKLFSLL